MQTVVLILMFLVIFIFMLKLSFQKIPFIILMAGISALFIGLMEPVAIEQSKSQIAMWLNNPSLMLDTSVILTIEVAIQLSFCMLVTENMMGEIHQKTTRYLYYILRYFPSVLFFAVLFSLLVAVIFQFPGVEFSVLAWTLAGGVFILLPLGVWAVKKILPENSIRLEMLFLTNALLSILGIVATVNGRTAVEGFSEVNYPALIGIIGLVVIGLVLGIWFRKIYYKKYINHHL